MTRLHTATVPVDVRGIEKLLRSWGWSIKVSTGNHNTWQKDGTNINVRRAGKEAVTWEPIRIAAKLEGITPEVWLLGPQDNNNGHKAVSDEEIDFYLNWHGDETTRDRFNNIRHRMRHEGTLQKWQDARERHHAEAKRKMENSVIEPLPVKVDTEGRITLDGALRMRNLRQNELSRTACEVIAIFSEGDLNDERGQVVRRIHERLPDRKDKAGLTGISMQLRLWEEAGLIWRELKGKRCMKAGLCIPVVLTSAEKRRYLKKPPAEQQPIVTSIKVTEAEAETLATAPLASVPATAPETPQAAPEPPAEPIEAQLSFKPALDVLRAEQERCLEQARKWTQKARNIEQAITTLENS